MFESTSVFFVCLFFFCFCLTVSLGSQRSVPGRTCEEIFIKEDSAADGLYWLNSNGTEDPYVTFCNMKKEGGINTRGYSININRFYFFLKKLVAVSVVNEITT